MYNRFYYTYIDIEHKTIIAPFYILYMRKREIENYYQSL